jgi:hypothetical protein
MYIPKCHDTAGPTTSGSRALRICLLFVILFSHFLWACRATESSVVTPSSIDAAPVPHGGVGVPAPNSHSTLPTLKEGLTVEGSGPSSELSTSSHEHESEEGPERKPVDVLSLFVIALLIGVFTHHVLKFTRLPYTALLMVSLNSSCFCLANCMPKRACTFRIRYFLLGKVPSCG